MTKQEYLEQIADALQLNDKLISKIFDLILSEKSPNLSYRICTLDYYSEEYLKMLKYPKRYKKWRFIYCLEEIKKHNGKVENYIQTGIWA